MGKTKLLLHTCCAPCLTVSAERLKPDHDVTVFWYNPNIEPETEHEKRFDTLTRYLERINLTLIKNYEYAKENKKWHIFIKGLELEPEGGKRCQKCIELRLRMTRQAAQRFGIEHIATTLTTSPHKDSDTINLIGTKTVTGYTASYLATNFKGKEGYKRSIELSNEFDLYRQRYCGCQYSIRKKVMD